MLDIEFGDTPGKKGGYMPEEDPPEGKETDAVAEDEKDYEGEDPEEEEEKSRFWFWMKLIVFLVIVLSGIGIAVWLHYPTQLLEEDTAQTEGMGTDAIPGRTGGPVLSDVEDPGTPSAGIEGREEQTQEESKEPVSGNDREQARLQPVEETGKASEQNYGTVSYSDELAWSASTKDLSLIFQNPADSTVDMKIAVYAEGKCLWQSELLKPGSGIQAVGNVEAGLEPGKYPCEIRVSHYDPEDGGQFAFELSIDAKLEVVK